MKLHFTRIHDTGDDFVVLNGIQTPINFTLEQWVAIAGRHFGVGADQLLLVERSTRPDVDFRYRIFNHNDGEVEYCGNGTRCLVKFIAGRDLTDKRTVRVGIMNGVATLTMRDDGQATVDMGAPVLEAARLPLLPEGLPARTQGDDTRHTLQINGRAEWLSTVSMGNPHTMQIIGDTEAFPALEDGPLIKSHAVFLRHVNTDFIQIVDRHSVHLRMYERGAGGTLACGTGACTAVATGIRRGLLGSPVKVATHGDDLAIAWAGGGQPVVATGPATTVFEGTLGLDTFKLTTTRQVHENCPPTYLNSRETLWHPTAGAPSTTGISTVAASPRSPSSILPPNRAPRAARRVT